MRYRAERKSKVEVPSGKAIEVSPKLIVEARQNSLVVFGILEATKNLIVNLELQPLLPSLGLRRRRRVVHSTAAALVVLHHH